MVFEIILHKFVDHIGKKSNCMFGRSFVFHICDSDKFLFIYYMLQSSKLKSRYIMVCNNYRCVHITKSCSLSMHADIVTVYTLISTGRPHETSSMWINLMSGCSAQHRKGINDFALWHTKFLLQVQVAMTYKQNLIIYQLVINIYFLHDTSMLTIHCLEASCFKAAWCVRLLKQRLPICLFVGEQDNS